MDKSITGVLYYSHSMRIYGTKREQKEISIITKFFPKATIYNPDNIEVSSHLNPMRKCLDIIRNASTTGIIISTYKGYTGKGVYTEIQEALAIDKPIWIINRRKITPIGNISIKVININWAVEYAIIEHDV